MKCDRDVVASIFDSSIDLTHATGRFTSLSAFLKIYFYTHYQYFRMCHQFSQEIIIRKNALPARAKIIVLCLVAPPSFKCPVMFRGLEIALLMGF